MRFQYLRFRALTGPRCAHVRRCGVAGRVVDHWAVARVVVATLGVRAGPTREIPKSEPDGKPSQRARSDVVRLLGADGTTPRVLKLTKRAGRLAVASGRFANLRCLTGGRLHRAAFRDADQYRRDLLGPVPRDASDHGQLLVDD